MEPKIELYGSGDKKQIFHVFLFNIRNYSSEFINIQRREVDLNIILPKVNNFDNNKKKDTEYLFYYMAPTPNKISKGKGYQNTGNFVQNTSVFVKDEIQLKLQLQRLVNHFISFLLIFFSQIINSSKQQ